MTLVKKKRNGNGHLFPTFASSFLSDRFFNPTLFNFDDFDGNDMRIPPVNISETEKEFRIEVSAPGFKNSDFKIEVDNGDLLVSSEKQEEEKEEKKNYWRREFSHSSFSRRFPLPDNCSEDNINAKYDNGMLHITIPKKEATISKPRKEIKVS